MCDRDIDIDSKSLYFMEQMKFIFKLVLVIIVFINTGGCYCYTTHSLYPLSTIKWDDEYDIQEKSLRHDGVFISKSGQYVYLSPDRAAIIGSKRSSNSTSIYAIKSDTVTIHSYEIMGMSNSVLNVSKFLIVNDSTLKLIDFYGTNGKERVCHGSLRNFHDNNDTVYFSFVPKEICPTPCSLREKSWLYNNKDNKKLWEQRQK